MPESRYIQAYPTKNDKILYVKKPLIKKRQQKWHKKSKRSNIKYFLTVYFQTETTQKCKNLVDTLLVLHF